MSLLSSDGIFTPQKNMEFSVFPRKSKLVKCVTVTLKRLRALLHQTFVYIEYVSNFCGFSPFPNDLSRLTMDFCLTLFFDFLPQAS